jgi:uncharacterized protein YoxC
MSQQILILNISLFILMLGQLVLILLSIKWLNKIRLTCRDIDVTNKRFSSVYPTAQAEVAQLYQKITELANSTMQKENHMLHTTFHVEEVEIYVKMLLEEFRTFVKTANK